MTRLSPTAPPKVGDRVKPADQDGPATGRVDWVRADGLVCLVTWDDGSGCSHWGTSQLEAVAS